MIENCMLAYELVIANPLNSERGQVHFDYDGGYVACTRVVWDHWGTLPGFEDGELGEVTGEKIERTLWGDR
jgi:hypothetical protein